MKKLIRAVFEPPYWFRCLFGVISTAALIVVFRLQLQRSCAAYVVYLLSALGLYYLITGMALPLFRKIKALLWRSRYIRRYHKDAAFKARVNLYSGTALNIVYAAFKLIAGLYYGSEWMIAVAVYYAVLILLKQTLVRQDLRHLRARAVPDNMTQWKTYRRTGWLMLLMNIGLSGITAQVVARNESFYYPGVIIFAIAAYSFYRIVIAVIRLLKFRRHEDPIFAASGNIDVCFAVTAMFTLQTAMFASFAEGKDVRIPNIITGTAVAMIATSLAVFMIVKASGEIRRLSEEQAL